MKPEAQTNQAEPRQGDKVESVVVPLPMNLRWRYASGTPMARLLKALGEQRLIALRCDECQRRYLPPRPFCGNCRKRLSTWVPVQDEGTLEAWTIMYLPMIDGRTGKPRNVPYAMGLVRLDGADTTINHFISTLDPAQLRIGQRVKAVWRSERLGALDDIASFEPAAESAHGSARAQQHSAPMPDAESAPVPSVLREGEVRIPFRYAAGPAASRFLVALRDEQVILGSRCQHCGRVRCPASSFCGRCGQAGADSVRVGPQGRVISWTQVPGGSTMGLIALDGADTPLTHRLLGDGFQVGARVVARFSTERAASINDLEGFAKLEEKGP